MPVAQRYGQRRVSLDRLPGARRTAAETDTSLGVGLARETATTHRAAAAIGDDVLRTASTAAIQMAQQAKQRADDTAFLEATNTFTTRLNDWQYNPQTGAYNKKGKSAMDLPTEFEDTFTKAASEVSTDLSTPEQRVAFNRWLAQQHSSIDVSVKRHVSTQMDAYEAGEARAALTNVSNAIATNYQDLRVVGEQLGFGESIIRKQIANQGGSQAQTDAALADFRSQSHESVINRMVGNGETTQARKYFTELKSQITDKDVLKRVEATMQEGTIREQAQEALGSILGDQGLDSLEKQRKAAREKYSGELEDRVLQGLEHENALKENADRDRRVKVMTDAKNALERSGGRLTAIDPTEWVGMSLTEAGALRNYADALVHKKPIVTHFNTQYQLKLLAAEKPEEFRKLNLNAYIDRVSGGDLDELANMQVAITRGDTKAAEKQLSGFMTQSQVVNDTMVQYGFNPSAKDDTPDGRAVALVRNILDREVQAAQAATKKELSGDEVRSKLQEILASNVEVKGVMWGAGGTKPLAKLTIADVGGRRPILEQALRTSGRPLSDAALVQLDAEVRLRLGTAALDESAITRIPHDHARTVAAVLTKNKITPTASAIVRLYIEMVAKGTMPRQ